MPSELRQPSRSPTALLLPHGHAVPVPSPKQYCVMTPGWFSWLIHTNVPEQRPTIMSLSPSPSRSKTATS
jgi:hypothetical protein